MKLTEKERLCIFAGESIGDIHDDRARRPYKARVKTMTETQVRDIRARLAAGANHKDLAARFGRSVSTIGKIHRREIWAEVNITDS